MLATVAVVVATHNLAIGVIAGVLVAMVLFARRVAHLVTVDRRAAGDEVVYTVRGELFFASSNDLVHQFEYTRDPDRVVVDLAEAHVWDASSVAALDAITTRYSARGKTVDIVGLNEASAGMLDRLAGQLG
jgi:SulP family sulfate permease